MKIFRFAGGEMRLGNKAYIMGILNVTPDSFSDGGVFLSPTDAVCHAKKMIAQGADIIDIGAMSTRPGSEPVPPEEEIERLRPVLSEFVSTGGVISVDTVNPETAEFALSQGANIVNDVSGLFNPDMASVVKKYSAGWVITHTGNVPAGTVVDYPDGVVQSVNDFFDDVLVKCEDFGIRKEYLCLDPGFGFAKTTKDNVELLKNLNRVVRPDVAFLTGLSRKRFIGELTNVLEASERIIGTVSADIIALMNGSDFIRVHDVKEAAESVAIYNSIM